MKAILLFQEKRVLVNSMTQEFAVAELKIWKIPLSKEYPEGKKYSLFLVASDGEVIIGLDNHKPKGHHLHLGKTEIGYLFTGEDQLLEDFWNLVRKAGYDL